MTKISTAPVDASYDIINYDKAKKRKLELFRITSSACVTPLKRGDDSITYDGTSGFGLISAIRNALDKSCDIEVVTLRPCTRVVSKNGQTDFLEPYPGVEIQYGAGGGGGTRAADGVVREQEKAPAQDEQENPRKLRPKHG